MNEAGTDRSLIHTPCLRDDERPRFEGASGPRWSMASLIVTGYPGVAEREETIEDKQAMLKGLLARVGRGDEAAFAALYDHTAPRVYALTLRVTGARESAEEAVADAYFQVWQQARLYDEARGKVLTWILTIARSRALDLRRRRDTAMTHPEPDILRPDLHRDDCEPLDLLLTMERADRLHDALRTLDETQRRLLSLAFFAGLTHQEIAAQCGMPLGTVKSLLRRTMQALKPLVAMGTAEAEEIP